MFLEIRYESVHIHVCSVYSCVVQGPNSGLGCIKFDRFQDHTQLDTHAHPIWLLCGSDQLVADTHTFAKHNKHNEPTFKPLSGFETVLPATKQPNQQDRLMLIFCTLNSLFLNTFSSHDVINTFKLSTQLFRLHV